MRIAKITVGKGLTIYLGEFSTVKPNIELEAEIHDGDDYDEVRRHLMDIIDAHLEEELNKHMDEGD